MGLGSRGDILFGSGRGLTLSPNSVATVCPGIKLSHSSMEANRSLGGARIHLHSLHLIALPSMEIQGDGIDTVTLPRREGPVIENMT